jgi:hypothetical protein
MARSHKFSSFPPERVDTGPQKICYGTTFAQKVRLHFQ